MSIDFSNPNLYFFAVIGMIGVVLVLVSIVTAIGLVIELVKKTVDAFRYKFEDDIWFAIIGWFVLILFSLSVTGLTLAILKGSL